MRNVTPQMDDMLTVGQRIVSLRLKRGLSAADLAHRTGVRRRALGYWEGGRCYPNAQSLYALADALSVTVDELLGRTEARPIDGSLPSENCQAVA